MKTSSTMLKTIFCLGCLALAVIATSAQECKDTDTYKTRCPLYKKASLCLVKDTNKYLGFMTDHCRKTCSFCAEEKDCSDNQAYSKECQQWKTNKFCEITTTNVYLGFMKANCRKTCGFCVAPPPPCEDHKTHINNCPGWIGYCKKSPTNRYYGFMMDKCKKTCGKCDDQTTTPKTQECGLRPSERGRVIGGTNATANSWPWQTALLYNSRYACGGTLIDKQWILTASHCVYGYSSKLFGVVLGEHDREKFEGREQNIDVDKIFVHPNYNPSTFASDIALLKLVKPATLNLQVTPACLPKQDETVSPQTLCFLTGWGKVVHPGPFGRFLQQVELPVVHRTTCQKSNNPLGLSLDVTDEMICAGEGPTGGIKSGCHGDSGGPLVCATKDRWVVQGAVSWGSASCDAKLKYTVFARVGKFVSWIENTMKGN